MTPVALMPAVPGVTAVCAALSPPPTPAQSDALETVIFRRALARDRAAGDDVVLEREVAGRGDEAVRDVDADRPLDAEVGGAGEREPGDAGERRPVQRRRRSAAGCLVHLDVERADVELDARHADERRGRDRELEAGVRREAVLERSERETDPARGDPDRARVDGPVVGRIEAAADADPELAARAA